MCTREGRQAQRAVCSECALTLGGVNGAQRGAAAEREERSEDSSFAQVIVAAARAREEHLERAFSTRNKHRWFSNVTRGKKRAKVRPAKALCPRSRRARLLGDASVSARVAQLPRGN